MGKHQRSQAEADLFFHGVYKFV
uniref:Uncharacterized protein n=1 Tax=Anguilla anguilla TaxID=7936 RepID=A0A0E9UNM7_ANGAN